MLGNGRNSAGVARRQWDFFETAHFQTIKEALTYCQKNSGVVFLSSWALGAVETQKCAKCEFYIKKKNLKKNQSFYSDGVRENSGCGLNKNQPSSEESVVTPYGQY